MVEGDFIFKVSISKSQHLILDVLNNSKEIRVLREGNSVVIEARKLKVDEALSAKLAILYSDVDISTVSGDKEERFEPDIPARVKGILNCPNQNCVSSQPKEPAVPEFVVVSRKPVLLLCVYCGRYLHQPSEELFNVTKKFGL